MTDDRPKLTVKEFAYILASDPETEQSIIVRNRSMIAWDETRTKRKWPSSSEAPSLWQTFIVWDALVRAGRYTGKFDEFKDRDLIDVDLIDDDDRQLDDPAFGDVAVDPTSQAQPGPLSSSPSSTDQPAPAGFPGGTRTTPS